MTVIKDDTKVTLLRANGSSTEIYLFGASITSWKAPSPSTPDKIVERLFLSDKAVLDGSKAIRGGVPLCWPTFGPAPSDAEAFPYHSKLAQHGFARNSYWQVGEERDGANPSVEFVLEPSEEIAKIFPYPFQLSYTVTLNEFDLDVKFTVNNTSPVDSLKFQNLLHTYYRVPSHTDCQVSNLKGAQYVDKMRSAQVYREDREQVVTDGVETDRVYEDLGSRTLTLAYGGDSKEGLNVSFEGYKDCTVWNPAAAKTKTMADMPEDGYKTFLCIEPGYVKEFIELGAGRTWTGRVVSTVL